MQKTTGLGRGLSSLIPNKRIVDDSPAEKNVEPIFDGSEKIWQLPIEKVLPNQNQPRQNFDEESLGELVESIREHGIIQPLIVAKAGDDWDLIAGERRLRAAKTLGLATVPAVVRSFDEQQKMEVSLIENVQREDLNAVEVASAYKRLIEEFNLTQEELSKKVGKNVKSVGNTLRILNAIDEVKQAIVEGKISEGHARVLVGLPPEDQKEMLAKIIGEKFSVRATEKAGRNVVIDKNIRKLNFDPEARAKEEELERFLNTKVDIKKFAGAGQIIIKFFSDEEFREIVSKIL